MSDLGNKAIMAKNIRYYLDISGKKRKEICKDLGFPYTTFADWFNGEAYPRIDKIEMMANYFGISKSDLVENHDLPPNAIPVGTLGVLPIIGNVSAGNGTLAYDDVLGYEAVDERYANDNYFYLHVVGDSMSPKIENNDLVLVHKQESIDSGNYAVVVVDEESGCVKQVKYGTNWIELCSVNPYYPIRRFDGSDVLRIRIIGRVIEVKRKL